jgi:predicted lipoprotein
MLENLADNVMIPAMEDFQARSADLENAVQAYQEDNTNEDLKQAAQHAWDEAMLAWQGVEVMQTGPLVVNSSFLRDSIYSWPSKSTCAVDQEVIEAESDGYSIAQRTPLRKGLDALEYVLYTPELDHTCPSSTSTTQGWDDRPDADRRAARLNYALDAAGDLGRLADELLEEWATGENSFRDELLQAGTSASRFDTDQEAANAVSDALFYFEKQVKDTKLAEPLGLKGNKCDQGQPECAESVESLYSERSREHIRQNLITFRQLFLGNSADGTGGPGFDDLIDSASGENVSAAMEADINETLAAIDQLDLSLQAAVTDINGINQVEGIWESSKKVTDRLKNDFLTVLGLSIPAAAAGDGD